MPKLSRGGSLTGRSGGVKSSGGARFSGDARFSGVGRTMTGKLERVASESERLAAHEKAHRKKTFSTVVSVLIIVIVILGAYMGVKFAFSRATNPEVVEEKFVPTVEIVDEGARGVTEKMRDYVGMLEADLADLGLRLKKVVVPADKTREVDAYFPGYKAYFKCSLDRGTAETAEDIKRMAKYLGAKGKKSLTYVDVRLEGRAYYK